MDKIIRHRIVISIREEWTVTWVDEVRDGERDAISEACAASEPDPHEIRAGKAEQIAHDAFEQEIIALTDETLPLPNLIVLQRSAGGPNWRHLSLAKACEALCPGH